MIFAGYTGSKNPVRNRLKIQFVAFGFSNFIFQIQVKMDRAEALQYVTSISVMGSVTEDISNRADYCNDTSPEQFSKPFDNYPAPETIRHNNPSHYMKQGMNYDKFESKSRTKTFLSTSFPFSLFTIIVYISTSKLVLLYKQQHEK